MRTTVSLDEDLVAGLRELAHERGVTFKDALNGAVRAGLAGGRSAGAPYRVPARPMGLRPGVDLDRASQLSADLEDEAVLRKLDLRK